jgi:hypothetical protein
MGEPLTSAAISFLSIPRGERETIMSGPANTAFTCALGGEAVQPSELACCLDHSKVRSPFPSPAPIFSCGSCFDNFRQYRGESWSESIFYRTGLRRQRNCPRRWSVPLQRTPLSTLIGSIRASIATAKRRPLVWDAREARLLTFTD